MKNQNQENKEKNYQAYLLIGITLLAVGFIATGRASDGQRFGVGWYFYAIFLFVQAFFSYHGKEELFNEFLGSKNERADTC